MLLVVINVVCKEECAGLDGALSFTYYGKRNPYPGSRPVQPHYKYDDTLKNDLYPWSGYWVSRTLAWVPMEILQDEDSISILSPMIRSTVNWGYYDQEYCQLS